MENECSIVLDLLPLYEEQMLRPETARFVEAHLRRCPDCRNSQAAPAPLQEPEAPSPLPLRKLRKKLTLKRLQTVLLTALLVTVVLLSVFAILDAPEYFPYDPALLTLREDPEGSLTVIFSPVVTDYACTVNQTPEGTRDYCLEVWTSPWDRLFSRRQQLSLTLPAGEIQGSRLYYLSNNIQEDTLLWGPPTPESGRITLPRLAPLYYSLLMAALFLILLVLWLLFRKKPGLRLWTERLLLLPPLYALSHLIVLGFDGTTYDLQRDLGLMVLLTALLYAAALLLHSRIRARKVLPKAGKKA